MGTGKDMYLIARETEYDNALVFVFVVYALET